MAWPIRVARNAPTMPSTVVRMKPLGLFGPGERKRAMMPATKPTMMIQIKPPMLMVVVLSPQMKIKSEPAGNLVLSWQAPVRRQMVDHLRQILAEAVEQVVARHAALGCQRIDLVGAERIGEIAGRD